MDDPHQARIGGRDSGPRDDELALEFVEPILVPAIPARPAIREEQHVRPGREIKPGIVDRDHGTTATDAIDILGGEGRATAEDERGPTGEAASRSAPAHQPILTLPSTSPAVDATASTATPIRVLSVETVVASPGVASQ